jgi:group I intron endonuclease
MSATAPIVYHIYFITNNIDGTVYVGLTKRPRKRWNEHLCRSRKGSKFYVHSAIRKYGSENFSFDLVNEYDSLEKAKRAEIIYIAYLKESDIRLYNLTDGGETSPHANIGRPMSQALKDRLSIMFSGENNPFYGKTHTEEIKSKCIDAGRRALEIREEKLGEEYVAWYKASCMRKSIAASGENNPFYGKTHSEDSLKKMSAWQVGTGLGEDNVFYGKHHTIETKRKVSLSNTKLTKSDRDQIIEERNTLGSTYQVLADKYSVSIQTIANVLKGKYAYLSI